MHEHSLVKSLLRQVDEVLDENLAAAPSGIEIEVGPLSGIEIALVKSAFDEISPGTRSCGAKLKIHETPLVVRCLECGMESNLQAFVFRCGGCDSGQVQIVKGDEVRLLSLTVG